MTTTQLITTTSTSINVQTFSTTSEVPIIDNYQFEISGASASAVSAPCQGTYLTSNDKPYSLDAGQIHVTFSSSVSPYHLGVDFWILTESQFPTWNQASCSDMASAEAVYYQHNLVSYDGVITIPTKGNYYLAFANYDTTTVSVTITVDQAIPTQGKNYSTQTTVFQTQQVTMALQPIGLSTSFYAGITIFAAGMVTLVPRARLIALRRTNRSDKSTRRSEKALIQPGTCAVCGAALIPNARFCKECGTAVGQI